MAEKIGEFLNRIGLIGPEQIERILAAQKNCDDRSFGEIAVSMGFVNGAAISDYLEAKKKALKDSYKGKIPRAQ